MRVAQLSEFEGSFRGRGEVAVRAKLMVLLLEYLFAPALHWAGHLG